MNTERIEDSDDKHGKSILIATLMTVLMTPEQRAAITAKYPKEMGEVAGLIAQILPPDRLKELSLTGTETEKAESQKSTQPEIGSKRLRVLRRIVAHVPFIRRFL